MVMRLIVGLLSESDCMAELVCFHIDTSEKTLSKNKQAVFSQDLMIFR